MQLEVGSHLAWFRGCGTRSGTYTQYATTPNNDPQGANTQDRIVSPNVPSVFGTSGDIDAQNITAPEVCSDGFPAVLPNLAFGWHPLPKWGFGAGLFVPTAIGRAHWGSKDRGTVRVDGQELPSPLRYDLVEKNIVLVYPTLGVGYAPHPAVRLGAAIGFGVGNFAFSNAVRPVRGEEFGRDVFATIDVRDNFVPRITLSALVRPHKNLDLTLVWNWQDDVRASGTTRLISTIYRETPADDVRLNDIRFRAPQPWQLTLGARYAQPRASDGDPSTNARDTLSQERWDIELDVVYERNSQVDAFVLDIPAGNTIRVEDNLEPPIPTEIRLPMEWRDQIAIRLGGDYNLLADRLALRLGFSYESPGVETGYAQLTFMPFERLGAHLGATLRVGKVDLSLAYAYIRALRTTETDAEANLTQVIAVDTLGGPTVFNAGSYTAQVNVLSLSANVHLR